MDYRLTDVLQQYRAMHIVHEQQNPTTSQIQCLLDQLILWCLIFFTIRLSQGLGSWNVSVSVSSRTLNVSVLVSSRTKCPTSRSRLGLKGLVHIPGAQIQYWLTQYPLADISVQANFHQQSNDEIWCDMWMKGTDWQMKNDSSYIQAAFTQQKNCLAEHNLNNCICTMMPQWHPLRVYGVGG